MNPLIPTVIGSIVKLIADRTSKENLKHPTTIAAAGTAASTVLVSDALPPDSPEALITQAVLAVLSVVLFFYPPRKKSDG